MEHYATRLTGFFLLHISDKVFAPACCRVIERWDLCVSGGNGQRIWRTYLPQRQARVRTKDYNHRRRDGGDCRTKNGKRGAVKQRGTRVGCYSDGERLNRSTASFGTLSRGHTLFDGCDLRVECIRAGHDVHCRSHVSHEVRDIAARVAECAR